MRAAKEQRGEGRTSEPVSSLKRLIKEALSTGGEWNGVYTRKAEWRGGERGRFNRGVGVEDIDARFESRWIEAKLGGNFSFSKISQ